MTRPGPCSLDVINVEYLIHSILHMVSKGSNITNAHVCSLSCTCTVYNLSLRKLNLIYSKLQQTNDVTEQLHALVICFDNRCVIYRSTPPPPSPTDCFPQVPAQVEFCATRDWVYIWANIFTRMCVPLKSKLQHTGPWTAAAWPPQPPERLCYRLAVVFRHILLIALSFFDEKLRRLFPKWYYLDFSTIKKFACVLRLRKCLYW